MISQGFNRERAAKPAVLREDFTLLREILRAVTLTVKHRSNGRLIKKTQRRGARRSMSGGVLFLYVDAKSVERNEAYESFSAACYGPCRVSPVLNASAADALSS